MNKVLQQLLTGKDNVTHDVLRWLALVSVLVALYLSVYVVMFKEQPFDMQQFGIGMGAVFVAVGIALKLKEDSEPDRNVGERTRANDPVAEVEKENNH